MILILLDLATGLAGLVLGALVTWGYGRALTFSGPSERRLVLLGVVFVFTALGLRMGWHDVARPALYFLGWMGPPGRSWLAASVNVISNAGTVAGQLALLGALHRTIPAEDRAAYTWLTAPFYPPGLRLWPGPRRRA